MTCHPFSFRSAGQIHWTKDKCDYAFDLLSNLHSHSHAPNKWRHFDDIVLNRLPPGSLLHRFYMAVIFNLLQTEKNDWGFSVCVAIFKFMCDTADYIDLIKAQYDHACIGLLLLQQRWLSLDIMLLPRYFDVLLHNTNQSLLCEHRNLL